jgi:hypothetical protein
MEKTTLYLPKELQRLLRDTAKATGRSQTELVREALDAYLSKVERPFPQSVGIGDDDLTARDSEKWLMREWSGK